MKIPLSCLLIILMTGLQAQQTDTRAITGGGASFSFNGGTIDISVGEMANQTLSSGNLILTQGLLQPHSISGVGIVNGSAESLMRIYPNPTTDVLRIEMESDHAFQGRIYDTKGRVVAAFLLQNQTDFDASSLSVGAYVLVLSDTERSRRFSVRFVKR